MKNLYRYCCSNIRVYVLTVMKRMHKSPTYRLPKNIKNIIVFILRFAKIFFEFLALKRVYLPYLEISLTTRCSLKCKDCSYYMPNIKEDSHKSLSFEDFKLYIDNLLQNVKRLQKLILIGGEPLLNKNINMILRYALEHKKIEDVQITTNGTIDFSDELISILKQYPNNVSVCISDYRVNKELLPKLKTDVIEAKLRQNNISVVLIENFSWYSVTALKYYNRSKKENEQYFISCSRACTHIMGGIMYVCPKAAALDLLGIYTEQKDREVPGLLNPLLGGGGYSLKKDKECISLFKPATKREFIDFYSNTDFSVCNYCNHLEDREHQVIPALQI